MTLISVSSGISLRARVCRHRGGRPDPGRGCDRGSRCVPGRTRPRHAEGVIELLTLRDPLYVLVFAAIFVQGLNAFMR